MGLGRAGRWAGRLKREQQTSAGRAGAAADGRTDEWAKDADRQRDDWYVWLGLLDCARSDCCQMRRRRVGGKGGREGEGRRGEESFNIHTPKTRRHVTWYDDLSEMRSEGGEGSSQWAVDTICVVRLHCARDGCLVPDYVWAMRMASSARPRSGPPVHLGLATASTGPCAGNGYI